MPLLDRCYFNSTTSGIADFTIGAAVTGGLTPSQAGGVSGVVYSYVAQSTDQSQWEVGLCTYNASPGWTTFNGSTQSNGLINSDGTNVNTPAITPPATINAGDIIVMVLLVWSRTGMTPPTTMNMPAGWVFDGFVYSPGKDCTLMVAHKIGTASEPANYTFSVPDSGANVADSCRLGWAMMKSTPTGGVGAFDTIAFLDDAGTGFNGPGLNPLASTNDLVFAIFASTAYQFLNPASINPADMTEVANNTSNPLVVSYKVQSGTVFAAHNDSGNSTQTQYATSALAFKNTPQATIGRTTVIFSSNSNSKVNFTNPPQVAISPLAGLDFGNQSPITVTAATYTVDSGTISGVPFDTDIICNNAAGVVLTFPNASAWPGRRIRVRTIAAGAVTSASSNIIPVAGGSAGTALLTATAGKWASIQSDGTNWQVQMTG